MIVRKELVWINRCWSLSVFGHQIHLMVQKEAKRCGIEFMGGPQGQVVRFWIAVTENQDLVLIKDIEQELNITKSVASNLVKRMVQNGLVELEGESC